MKKIIQGGISVPMQSELKKEDGMAFKKYWQLSGTQRLEQETPK